jgi:hypothetical protein
MFKKLIEMWNDYKFEIILGFCILFIVIFALIRIGKKGSWSKFVIIDDEEERISSPKRSEMPRGRPTESKGEIECKRVLEDIFKVPFNKARPKFLSNPVTGGNYNLELDCFNEELRLAVEYNGCQHYKYTPFFHRNEDAFMNQKYRDEMKRTKCKENNVILIEVPYTVKIEDIKRYIMNELKKYNVRYK